MKRGIALENLATLIVAVVLLAILLTLFFYYNGFYITPIVMFNHLSTMLRGFAISALFTVMWVIIAAILILVWTTGFCYQSPVQAAVCAGLSAALTGAVVAAIYSAAGAIPLVVFAPIKMTISPQGLENDLALYSADCAAMINYGHNDPLVGKPNPVQCFALTLKNGDYNFSKALENFNEPYFIYPGSGWIGEISKDYDRIEEAKYGKKTFTINYNKTTGDLSVILWYHNGSNLASMVCKTVNIKNTPYYLSWDMESCNSKLNSGRIFVKVKGDKILVAIGDFKLYSEMLPEHDVRVVEDGNYKCDLSDTSKCPTITVDDTHKKIVFIEFYDSFYESSFNAPECGNNDEGEGVYICIKSI